MYRWRTNIKKKAGDFLNKKRLITLSLYLIIIVIGTLCFNFIVPKKVTTTDDTITKITIFNGNTGNQTIITNPEEIQTIVTKLNGIDFLKTGISIGYMGYSLDITYFGEGDKEILNFIINGENTVQYKGFFYEPQNTALDYEYLANLQSD